MGKIRRTKKNRTLSGVMVHMFLLVFLGTVSVGIGKQAIRYQEVKEELALVTAEIQAEKEKQSELAKQLHQQQQRVARLMERYTLLVPARDKSEFKY